MNIKKRDLSAIATFLEGVPLSGSVSRSRTKLLNDIKDGIKELQIDEQSLLSESRATIKNEGSIVDFESQEDKESFLRSQQELYEEEVIISEKVVGQFNNLQDSLDNYDGELSGNSAEGFDNILTLLEQERENNENN